MLSVQQAKKLVPIDQLREWRVEQDCRIVATNGCFDVLHVGHLRFLREAASLGDKLVVGVNDDVGVRMLKGQERPIHTARDRAELISGLDCVDVVVIFPGDRADRFLAICQPQIWAKGGDYTLEELANEELLAVRSGGGQPMLLNWHSGHSTTRLLERLQA